MAEVEQKRQKNQRKGNENRNRSCLKSLSSKWFGSLHYVVLFSVSDFRFFFVHFLQLLLLKRVNWWVIFAQMCLSIYTAKTGIGLWPV